MSKPRFFMGAAGAATDQRLNMTDLRVLCILGTFTNNKGWCYPLQDTLAKLLHRSRPVVNAALKRLETCGYIESKKKKGGANRKLYRVVLDVKEDAHDLPEGLFEVETDVDPADISQRQAVQDVRPADMSAPPTCPPDRHVSPEVSAPPTIDVGPPDIQRELEPLNQNREKGGKPPASVKPHSLPVDWDPRDEEVRYAEGLNFTKQQFDLMLEDFRTHFLDRAKLKAGKKSNWNLTFRKWITTQAGYWKTPSQKPSPWLDREPEALDWPALLEEWVKTGRWPASLGPKPNEPDYEGPLEPLRPLIAGRNPSHPVIAAILAKLPAKQGALL